MSLIIMHYVLDHHAQCPWSTFIVHYYVLDHFRSIHSADDPWPLVTSSSNLIDSELHSGTNVGYGRVTGLPWSPQTASTTPSPSSDCSPLGRSVSPSTPCRPAVSYSPHRTHWNCSSDWWCHMWSPLIHMCGWIAQGMTVKLRPCLRFRACGWGCVRWKAPCRKGCGWFVKLTWLALFWVCITFCKVRHGDSATKPDCYYYLLFLCIMAGVLCMFNCILWFFTVCSPFKMFMPTAPHFLGCIFWVIVDSHVRSFFRWVPLDRGGLRHLWSRNRAGTHREIQPSRQKYILHPSKWHWIKFMANSGSICLGLHRANWNNTGVLARSSHPPPVSSTPPIRSHLHFFSDSQHYCMDVFPMSFMEHFICLFIFDIKMFFSQNLIIIGDAPPGYWTLKKLMEGYQTSWDTPPVDIKPRQTLAAICYSSGTTGLPKGCLHTHHNFIVNVRMML